MTQALVPAASIKLTSFACPNCGAHATQTWAKPRLEWYGSKQPTPNISSLARIEKVEGKIKAMQNSEERTSLEELVRHHRKILLGEPFVGLSSDGPYRSPILENLFVSQCYTCGKVALWLHDRLLYPPSKSGAAPNADLSPDVLHDYEEARSILDLSPRGACALLRLAVEKICIELDAEGSDINQRIAYLVKQGLPHPVQKALDSVRVIGNEAVHPGQLDLRDDRETATKLFDLVNFIANDRITRPKQIDGVYAMIPESKKDSIEARDAKAEESKK